MKTYALSSLLALILGFFYGVFGEIFTEYTKFESTVLGLLFVILSATFLILARTES